MCHKIVTVDSLNRDFLLNNPTPMVSAFRVERKEGPDNPDRSGLVQDGAGIQIKPELNRALAHHRPPAIAATAPDEIPAWKRCLGILEEVSGFSLRHIPAERIEQEPANIGHAFCREMDKCNVSGRDASRSMWKCGCAPWRKAPTPSSFPAQAGFACFFSPYMAGPAA